MLKSFIFFRVFQRVTHIPTTGKVDAKTLDVMRKPRCGLEDSFSQRSHKYRVLGWSPYKDHSLCQSLTKFFLDGYKMLHVVILDS